MAAMFVGLGRDLVLAVAQNAREAQRRAAGIPGRRPDRVPGISSALDGYGLGPGRPAAPFVVAGRRQGPPRLPGA